MGAGVLCLEAVEIWCSVLDLSSSVQAIYIPGMLIIQVDRLSSIGSSSHEWSLNSECSTPIFALWGAEG